MGKQDSHHVVPNKYGNWDVKRSVHRKSVTMLTQKHKGLYYLAR